MKIVVYEPQPEAEPVLRLKLSQTEDAVWLLAVDAAGTASATVLGITPRGLVRMDSVKPLGLPHDGNGFIKVVQ